MAWLGLLPVVFLILALRAPALRGTTYLLILGLTAVTLGIVLLQPIATP